MQSKNQKSNKTEYEESCGDSKKQKMDTGASSSTTVGKTLGSGNMSRKGSSTDLTGEGRHKIIKNEQPEGDLEVDEKKEQPEKKEEEEKTDQKNSTQGEGLLPPLKKGATPAKNTEKTTTIESKAAKRSDQQSYGKKASPSAIGTKKGTRADQGKERAAQGGRLLTQQKKKAPPPKSAPQDRSLSRLQKSATKPKTPATNTGNPLQRKATAIKRSDQQSSGDKVGSSGSGLKQGKKGGNKKYN